MCYYTLTALLLHPLAEQIIFIHSKKSQDFHSGLQSWIWLCELLIFFFSPKHWDTNHFFQVLELAAHFTPLWSKFPYGFCHAKMPNFRGFHVEGAAWSTGVLPGGAGQPRVSPSFPVPSSASRQVTLCPRAPFCSSSHLLPTADIISSCSVFFSVKTFRW